MIRFFVEPLVILFIILGLSLGIVGVRKFIERLDPFTEFQHEFMNSFYNPIIRAIWYKLNDSSGETICLFRLFGVFTGVIYSIARYQTPLMLIVFWSVFLVAQAFMIPFKELIHSFLVFDKPEIIEQLIRESLETVYFCYRQISLYGYIDDAIAGILLDQTHKVIQCFLHSNNPSAEHEDMIMTIIEMTQRIMCHSQQTFEDFAYR
jgi:hypothetical protein